MFHHPCGLDMFVILFVVRHEYREPLTRHGHGVALSGADVLEICVEAWPARASLGAAARIQVASGLVLFLTCSVIYRLGIIVVML